MSSSDKDPYIKVTFLKRIGYGIRLYRPNGQLYSETTVKTRLEVGNACRDMLRWYDKMGGCSRYADKARHRRGFKAIDKTKIDPELYQKCCEIYQR